MKERIISGGILNPFDLPRMLVDHAMLAKIDLPALVLPTMGCPSYKGYTIADLSAIEYLVRRESWSLDSFVQADARVEGRRVFSKRPLLAMVKASHKYLDFYGMKRHGK